MTEGLCPRSRGSALCYKVIGVTFLTGRGLFYFTSHIKIPADLFLLCIYVTGFASLRLQDIPQGCNFCMPLLISLCSFFVNTLFMSRLLMFISFPVSLNFWGRAFLFSLYRSSGRVGSEMTSTRTGRFQLPADIPARMPRKNRTKAAEQQPTNIQ